MPAVRTAVLRSTPKGTRFLSPSRARLERSRQPERSPRDFPPARFSSYLVRSGTSWAGPKVSRCRSTTPSSTRSRLSRVSVQACPNQVAVILPVDRAERIAGEAVIRVCRVVRSGVADDLADDLWRAKACTRAGRDADSDGPGHVRRGLARSADEVITARDCREHAEARRGDRVCLVGRQRREVAEERDRIVPEVEIR